MWVEYYSITKGGLTVFFHPVPGLALAALGIYGIYTARRDTEESPQSKGCSMKFLWAYTIAALLWTIGVGVDVYGKYRNLASGLSEGRYKEVVGEIKGVKTWPTRGGEAEHFGVDSVWFQYTSGGVNPNFNRTASYGGPIIDGQRVKIWYFEDKILKLWIWEEE